MNMVPFVAAVAVDASLMRPLLPLYALGISDI